MRLVFVGASEVTEQTARELVGQGHEVVIVESDKARIDELGEHLDCGFLHGDGSRPEVLREAAPKSTDILFCLTNHDQANIIASLVGRQLGFERVVTSIQDPEFEPVCEHLGLRDTIVPSRTIARYLADMCRGTDVLELSSLIKHEARLFSFEAGAEDAGPIGELALPAQTQVICFYRDDAFHLPGEGTRLRAGDEVVLITAAGHIDELSDRWEPRQSEG